MPRVLIVDDSPTTRELIARILDSDPEIEVIGDAIDGQEGVQMVQQLRPDVVTMDIHMPRLTGLEATERIMSSCPTPIVIVSASTLVHDVEWAMKALQAGALTLLLKPPGPASPDYAAGARELIETVKAMSAVKVVGRRAREAIQPQAVQEQFVVRSNNTIAIAASTGGPPAIKEILSVLPADFASPILIVQHIAHGFTSGFVTWLDSSIALRVKVAENNEVLQGGYVYVAPEGFHLGVTNNRRALLASDDPIAGFRPSGSFLFESVGTACRSGAVGVILTGMGSDGVSGLRTLRNKGGHVIAQDESTSVIYGMPAAAVEAGVVNTTLALDKIGPALLQATKANS